MAKHNEKYLLKYEWNEIQKFYDEGFSWKKVVEKFSISNAGLSFALKSGVFKTRSKSDANKIGHKNFPQKVSLETKKKISEGRIKYLVDNPDKVPYLLNHSSKESYPEKYFTELFQKEGINTQKKYRIGLYELDFCIPELKIDLEIDGEQHYVDIKIVESDKKRNKFLEDKGWKIIRIRWSEYNKKTFEEKVEFIKELKNNLVPVKAFGTDS